MGLLLRGKTVEELKPTEEMLPRDYALPDRLEWAVMDVPYQAYELHKRCDRIGLMGAWLDDHPDSPRWGERYVEYRVAKSELDVLLERIDRTARWIGELVTRADEQTLADLKARHGEWAIRGEQGAWDRIKETFPEASRRSKK